LDHFHCTTERASLLPLILRRQRLRRLVLPKEEEEEEEKEEEEEGEEEELKPAKPWNVRETRGLDLNSLSFLSARKADLKKGFQHLVVLVVVLVVVVVLVGTRVKKGF
jgi:t-SNARE complex subunit (syntaxin)